MNYSSYLAKQEAKGDWKPGDRVRVKSEYQGKTWAARAKRQGDWIVDYFKNVNWVLKRPDDWKHIPGYPKQLLAKAHQIEAAPKLGVKVVGEMKVTSIGEVTHGMPSVNTDKILHAEFTDVETIAMQKGGAYVEWLWSSADTKPEIKKMAKDHWSPKPKQPTVTPNTPITEQVPAKVGDIVIVKDPHGTIPKGTLFMVTQIYGITVDVTQLFTGVKYAAMKTWLIVLSEKDLTITYLPK